MEKWERKTRESFLPKMIRRFRESKTPDQSETKARKPHKVPKPFPLVGQHIHQDDDQAETAPAIFLACARKRENGELMRIKGEGEGGQEGDQKVYIICQCTNPEQKDLKKVAIAQVVTKPGPDNKRIRPVIPIGGHLVGSRIIFLRETSQPEDKEIFLLNTSHGTINTNTTSNLRKSAGQALTAITEDLKIEELQENAEVDREYFNRYAASAPTYEEVMKTDKWQETDIQPARLPYEPGMQVQNWKEDQGRWTLGTTPIEELKFKPDKKEHMVLIQKTKERTSKPLNELVKQYLSKLGFQNLEFTKPSQELGANAYPDEIWAYVMRYVPGQQEDVFELREATKDTVRVSFIRENCKKAWIEKIYVTADVTDEIRIAALVHDANKDATLNDMKRYFATWDGKVIDYLLAILIPEIKKETSDTKPDHPNDAQNYQIITAEAVKVAAAAKSAAEKATAEAEAAKTETAVRKSENEAIKAEMAKNKAELEHLSNLVQSART